MDPQKVTKTRELIDAGFYDDPEVLDGLIERCLERILRHVSRSAPKEVPPRIVSQPSTRRADRPGSRSTARPRRAAADHVVARQ